MENSLLSYPTPPNVTGVERMNDGFLKIHPGPPIHYFTECNDDEYHTHPAAFTSHILLGGYVEEVLQPNADGTWHSEIYERKPGTSHYLALGFPHKILGLLDGPCMTRCQFEQSTEKPGFCRFDEGGKLLFRFHDESDWRPYRV